MILNWTQNAARQRGYATYGLGQVRIWAGAAAAFVGGIPIVIIPPARAVRWVPAGDELLWGPPAREIRWLPARPPGR